jgi:hypothetical protein
VTWGCSIRGLLKSEIHEKGSYWRWGKRSFKQDIGHLKHEVLTRIHAATEDWTAKQKMLRLLAELDLTVCDAVASQST